MQYKHYYRSDANGFVTFAFSNGTNEVLETDFLIGEGERLFTPQIFNSFYQPIYKIVGGVVVERSQEELAAERLPSKTPDQLMIEMLQIQSGELLFELAKAQDDREALNAQMGIMLMNMAQIQEGIG